MTSYNNFKSDKKLNNDLDSTLPTSDIDSRIENIKESIEEFKKILLIKNKNNNEIIEKIDELIEKIINIFNNKDQQLISIINSDINLLKINNASLNLNSKSDSKKINKSQDMFDGEIDESDIFHILNTNAICDILFDKIHINIQNTLDKTKNIETFLSQTYVVETITFHDKILKLYNKIQLLNSDSNKKLLECSKNILLKKIQPIYNQTQDVIIKYITNQQQELHQYPFAIDLYILLIEEILSKINPEHKQLPFQIYNTLELDKNFILKTNSSDKTKFKKSNAINPPYKRFNLIPITPMYSINEIAQYLFKISVKTYKEFEKLCDTKNYGLILISSNTYSPILYDIIHLCNWRISQDFSKTNGDKYGLNPEIIERYITIRKNTIKTKWNFSISVSYKSQEYVVILESIGDSFRLLANYFSNDTLIFIRASSVTELINSENNTTKELSRVFNYNQHQINIAKKNMFLPIKVDMEKIKENSIIIDPKYLRNTIYLKLLNEFKSTFNAKKINDNYSYAQIIHNDNFLNIFSEILIKEFYTYLYANYDEYSKRVGLSEVISSFINVIYINQREFTKEFHDYFKNNIIESTVFEEDNSKKSTLILYHFDNLLQYVLNKIITNDSNVYQTMIYKINLLKNTFI